MDFFFIGLGKGNSTVSTTGSLYCKSTAMQTVNGGTTVAIVFSSSGGSLVFGGIFDEFVFPFFVVFDESVSDDEHFVHDRHHSDLVRFHCRDA